MVLNNLSIAISFYFDKIIKQCSYYLGNVYLVNYPLLNDISTGHHQGKKIEIAAPICLLYLRTDGELVPIAIQLRQNAGEKYPIWTPKDDPLDWLLVKMWFKNADLQVHQVKSHYALTHIIAEIFAVAMYCRTFKLPL